MNAPSQSYHSITAEILNFRRGLFAFALTLLTAFGAVLYTLTQPDSTRTTLDYILLPLFLILFFQIVMGFVLSLAGFIQKMRGGDPLGIMKTLDGSFEPGATPPSTALAIPIMNEDMARVAAGIRNMWKSLEREKAGASFDFFLLSDSSDPEAWTAEEEAWMELVHELNASGRIFYRKRKKGVNKKSGNIADFCRRWGRYYRYLIVLDADSIMTGKIMTRLVCAMERNPRVGLIQTVPYNVLGDSLFRRGIQFAMRICGPLLSAGASYWQLNSSNYWGHNAIIRLDPFMKHCALPSLPETESTNRHILSHDTIEAALMRKAGYDIWMVPDEEGSYEESPPTLSDMLLRDRRWCKGNFQHHWFLFAKGFEFSNKLHIWLGLMAYLSSPLWLIFIALNAWNAWSKQHDYFNISETASVIPPQVFLTFVLLLLFAAKFFGLITILPRMKSYGGGLKVFLSVLIEILSSVILAPIVMLFHSLFVFQIITGSEVPWATQKRTDTGLTWTTCLRTFGWVSALGAIGLAIMSHLAFDYLIWFLPILIPWLLAVPFAKFFSSPEWGRKAREWGLFLIPEETQPPSELLDLNKKVSPERKPFHLVGFARVLLQPCANALHLTLLHQWRRKDRATPRRLEALRQKAFSEGPDALSKTEQYRLLWDVQSVRALHQQLWQTNPNDLATSWRRYFRELERSH